MTDQQREIWEAEAAQLKKDLANRPKEVHRREVPIRLGNPQSPAPSPHKPYSKKSGGVDDSFLRRRLGL